LRRRATRTQLVRIGLAATLGAALTACSSVPPTSPDRTAGRTAVLDTRAASELREDGREAGRPLVFDGANDITEAIGAFRTALGALNPNQPGSFGSGRREINWDAVPAQFTNTDDFPADFFNQPAPGRARGAVFSTRGSGFRVSDVNFADLNPAYADQFEFFSPVRTFMPVGDHVMSVLFFVPGSNTPATSTGFGVVFSDIDHRGSGRLRLFDAADRELGTYLAPACPGGLSFLGVVFPDAIVARVAIVSGKAALGPDSFDLSRGIRGPGRDLVIMDDFLYGEPVATPAEVTTASASR
jgi:hypothetical protein